MTAGFSPQNHKSRINKQTHKLFLSKVTETLSPSLHIQVMLLMIAEATAKEGPFTQQQSRGQNLSQQKGKCLFLYLISPSPLLKI